MLSTHNPLYQLTNCDIICSITSWEVSEGAKKNGFPRTIVISSTSLAMSSGMAKPLALSSLNVLESGSIRVGGNGNRDVTMGGGI